MPDGLALLEVWVGSGAYNAMCQNELDDEPCPNIATVFDLCPQLACQAPHLLCRSCTILLRCSTRSRKGMFN
jgi:hypothetical protein